MKTKEIVEKCENIMADMKKQTLCFTGHRSQKLPWKFNEQDARCIKMREEARTKIIESIQQGYKVFISGMAIGFDMICAELVLELKKEFPDIKLVAALPCKDQDNRWSQPLRDRYRGILKQADIIWCENEHYTDDCMLARNRYMLNNSSKVIALYNGLGGGTKYTIDRAKEQGLEVEIIKP